LFLTECYLVQSHGVYWRMSVLSVSLFAGMCVSVCGPQIAIPLSEVTDITREKTAIFIPNAVGIRTHKHKVTAINTCLMLYL